MTDREAFEERFSYLAGIPKDTAWQAWQAALASKEPDVAALKAERDELLKDAARLDFLDRNLHWKMGWRVQKAPAGTLSVGPIIQLNGPTTGIREAIDAAIAKAEGGAA